MCVIFLISEICNALPWALKFHTRSERARRMIALFIAVAAQTCNSGSYSSEWIQETGVRCGYPSSLSGSNEACTNVRSEEVGVTDISQCLRICAAMTGCAGVDFIHPGAPGSGGQGQTSANSGRCFFRGSTQCGRSCSPDQTWRANGRSCYIRNTAVCASENAELITTRGGCGGDGGGEGGGGGGTPVGAISAIIISAVAVCIVLLFVIVAIRIYRRRRPGVITTNAAQPNNMITAQRPEIPMMTVTVPAVVVQGVPVEKPV